MKVIGFWVAIFIFSIPPFFYKFRHPEMTETQLLLNFFESYKEFFECLENVKDAENMHLNAIALVALTNQKDNGWIQL